MSEIKPDGEETIFTQYSSYDDSHPELAIDNAPPPPAKAEPDIVAVTSSDGASDGSIADELMSHTIEDAVFCGRKAGY